MGNDLYEISGILNKYGAERTDGRYPIRKGCVVRIVFLDVGYRMALEYVKDGFGNAKTGVLYTSLVYRMNKYADKVIIRTRNSIYILTEINKGV